MSIESMEVNSGALEKREEISKEITAVQQSTTSLIVTDNGSYSQAGDMLLAIKKVSKNIENYFKPLKDASHKAWKQICNRENEELEKLKPSLEHLNKQMTNWNVEQEKIRQAEEERLGIEALKAEEERRLAEALQAEKEGDKEEAEAIINEPVFVPPPIVEKTVPKQAGLTMTTTWKWRLKDINLVPRQYLQVNEVAVNAAVRSLKSAANIAGIEPYEVSSMRGVRS